MSSVNYAELVQQLVSDNPKVREAAKITLLQLDEDAVGPLVNQFYAGVNDAQGVALLTVIADIGGPEAMSTLRSMFHFEDSRLALKQAAATGLLHNAYSLSPNELVELKAYLEDSTGNSSS